MIDNGIPDVSVLRLVLVFSNILLDKYISKTNKNNIYLFKTKNPLFVLLFEN